MPPQSLGHYSPIKKLTYYEIYPISWQSLQNQNQQQFWHLNDRNLNHLLDSLNMVNQKEVLNVGDFISRVTNNKVTQMK